MKNMWAENAEQIIQLSDMVNNANKILTKNKSCNVCANACVSFDEETCYTSRTTYCSIRNEAQTNQTGFMCEHWKPIYSEWE